MTEEMKTQQWCGEYSRAISSYPLRKWWQLGLWRTDVECLQGSREAGSQYLPVPLFVPHISGLKVHPGQMEEQYRWRVSLDVAHFFPSEISLRIRDSFLEVTGKHEERPDEHGFAARCFTRKYRLPAEADTTKMVSTLSADGILTVEAPVPESSVPASTIIPIKVEMEEEKEKGRDKLPGHGRGPEHPDFPAAEDKGEVLQLEDHSHHGQPGSVANGLQQEEEEETFGEPAGESHPSVPADGRSSESLQEEGRGTDASEQPEPEVAEAITQPELSQLGKGPQSEEDQEQEHQEQEDQKQDQKQDQEQEDQKQDQEQEDQKQDQEQEDQKQDQEQEDQKQDQEQDQKQDQKQEDQKQEDQELEDQKQNQKQEDQKQDQEQEDQKQKDQELEGHDLKQESTE